MSIPNHLLEDCNLKQQIKDLFNFLMKNHGKEIKDAYWSITGEDFNEYPEIKFFQESGNDYNLLSINGIIVGSFVLAYSPPNRYGSTFDPNQTTFK